jgi:ubiquinone/menaquinone biosynthesis C-methylase UbiE
MKLNIGSDTVVLPKEHGWTNINLVKVHPDIVVLDVREGLPYGNESVEEIYAGNFFDHLTLFEGVKFLQEARRVLKPGGTVKFSLMDMDRIINAYLYNEMDQYAKIQPYEYRQMQDKSLKFAVFLLGNLAKEKEYTGHRMLYTPASVKEVAENCGFKVQFHMAPDWSQEPWCVENKEFQSHVFYVELVKGG